MAFHTPRHSLWGKFHSHGFSDERTLEAQPWRTEGLCPWRALIPPAWRPSSDQIKMLQAHHEQGNLRSAGCLVQRQLSCCLPSSPHLVISHTASLQLAQSQLIRQPHTFRVLQESLQRPGLLELPPCAIFISPSVCSSLGHIPFSKPQLCFLIRQFFVSMQCPTASPFLTLPGSVLTQTLLPTLTALSRIPCSIRRCSPHDEVRLRSSGCDPSGDGWISGVPKLTSSICKEGKPLTSCRVCVSVLIPHAKSCLR